MPKRNQLKKGEFNSSERAVAFKRTEKVLLNAEGNENRPSCTL